MAGSAHNDFAGVSSQRLHELRGISKRNKCETFFCSSSGLGDNVRDTLVQSSKSPLKKKENNILSKCCNATDEYAGLTSKTYNERFTTANGKKYNFPHSNRSSRMASILQGIEIDKSEANAIGKNFDSIGLSTKKRLKQYFRTDELNNAFCTKFQVTDKKTGRTEIMTARRPGNSAVEVNIANFDSYKARRERVSSTAKYIDRIEQGIMGFTPRCGEEKLHESCINIGACSPYMREGHIGAYKNWISPLENVKQPNILGASRRKFDVPWCQNVIDVSHRVTKHDDGRNRIFAFGEKDSKIHPIGRCILVDRQTGNAAALKESATEGEKL